MRLITAVNRYTTGVLLLAVIGALLAFWNIERMRLHVERMALAQSSYEAHLRMSSHSYQLFKQFGDALLIGDQDQGSGERELTSLIRQDITTIRHIIAKEIELVGEEEIDELELLEQIENKLEELIRKFDALIPSKGPESIASRWFEFTRLLDGDIDRDFRALMEEALEEEQEEVAETKELLAADMKIAKALSIAFSVCVVAFALGALKYFGRRVARPLDTLMTGVADLEAGKYEARFAETGSLEIDQVGNLLNSMAGSVKSRQENLESENNMLEQTVKERTAELERLLEEARVNASNRQRLLADVSHELRTPLTVIQGESDIALRGKHTREEDLREALKRSKAAAQHTAALVDDLLLISRQENGNLKLKTEAVDMVGLVRDAVALSPIIANIEAESATLPVTIDKLRIRQTLLALLQNAKSHGASTATVTIHEDATACRIAVADNGPGMTDAEKDSAFTRFYRGANAAGNYDEGYGLGLPIVKAIVEGHGGNVALEDSENGGLRVVLMLPRRAHLRSVS